ncbi:MAG: rhamnogalacturonan acetylesterase [Sedimentisphaerales bacterium]|nr:rhamnogalacturonan acetylesterase [Sedimentisphaerales bacterium]
MSEVLSKPVTIVLVGDSTVADYQSEDKLRGWGQIIPEFFDKDVVIKNFAKNGRSSKSFIKEGLWAEAIAEKADFVIIQFGHNDCPGKEERTTDPDGDYREYLRKYIDDSRKAGAEPILVTSVERRNFTKDGKIELSLEKYANAMKEVGKEEKVAVLDLHARSVELYETLGEEKSNYMNRDDRTHFTEEGARTITRLVVEEIGKKVPLLNKHLKKNR